MVPFRVGDKWGYSDTSGRLLIAPQYDQADFFDAGSAFVKIDSFYYLINSKTEILSEPLIQYGRFSSGLCPVRGKNQRSYYIDSAGRKKFNIIFSAAETFSEGLAVVSMKNKLGIINTKGEWVREPDFDSSSIYFKSGFLLAKYKDKFVYINRYGKPLSLPDTIMPAGIFSEGLAAVYVVHKKVVNNTSDTKYNLSFIDTTGRIALSQFRDDSMDYADYVNYEREFIDGKAIVNVPNQLASDHYYINKKGKFSHVFSFAQHLGDSMYLGVIGYYLPSVRIYDSSFFVMGDFSEVLTRVGVFGEGMLHVQNRAGYWGYCDSNTKMLIPYIYENANPFHKGYAIILKDGKYGVINKKGKEFFREY